MRLKVFAASVLFALCASAVAGTDEDLNLDRGDQLLAVCGGWIARLNGVAGPDNSMRALIEETSCRVFLKGVVESALWIDGETGKSRSGFCIPEGTKFMEMAAVVVKFLQDTPRAMSRRSTTVVLQALRGAYSCR